MIDRFPSDLLTLVACPRDGGELVASDTCADGLRDGVVRCAACGAGYSVLQGILDLLGPSELVEPESRRELEARQHEASRTRGAPGVQLHWTDEIEISTTLRHFAGIARDTVLELGCGAGTYTRPLSERCGSVLAVDFSREALSLNARALSDGAVVGLLRADIATLKLRAHAFDAVLTTAYSNLPTRTVRRAANEVAAHALKPGAPYFVSAHHQHLRRIAQRRPRRDRYPGSGIFFESFTRSDLKRELRASFDDVRVNSLCVWIPFVSRSLASRGRLSQIVARTPLLRDLALLLLAVATKVRSV
jgi:SAM-dependent methyltransferase